MTTEIKQVELEDGQSADIISENIYRLKELFPDAFSENGVNFDALRQLLGDASVLDEGEEKYGLNWHGKKKARQIALTPSTGTLLPCPEESVDWDTTQNLFIEGDNLEVLKLLQKSYANRVKVIYIDPPYNTGKEFIYPDKFQENLDTYLRYTGQVNDDGIKFASNTEVGGRKHTNWLSMMYPRLKLARNLLASDGVIFLSIDDNEHSNLKLICDDVFGQENFMGEVCRATGQTTGQDSGGLGSSFDYILVYSKNVDFDLSGLPLSAKDLTRFDNEDERGKYAYDQMRKTGSNDRREDRPRLFYPVQNPDGGEVYPVAPAGYESCWRFERKTYDRLLKDNIILWKKTKRDGDEIWWPYVKYYLEGRTKRPSPLWNDLDGNKKAARDVRALFDGKKVFDFPKPVPMIERCIQIAPNASEDDIVLDFFAGSGSTAHAALSLNKSDNGKRRFICVQLPESVDDGTEASKMGYQNIAQISRDRIKRAGDSLGRDEGRDVGFRTFKLSESNVRAWNPDRTDLEESLLSHEEHLVEGRSEQDVLYELLLKRGVDLAVPIEIREVAGKSIYSIGYGVLFACLDESITKDQVEDIAQGIVTWYGELAPSSDTHVFFRDSAFRDDVSKTNMAAILEQNGITHVRSL
jgi:adenine-specific DNA-methyltransferase